MNTPVIECIVIAVVLSIVVIGSALCVYGIGVLDTVIANMSIV